MVQDNFDDPRYWEKILKQPAENELLEEITLEDLYQLFKERLFKEIQLLNPNKDKEIH